MKRTLLKVWLYFVAIVGLLVVFSCNIGMMRAAIHGDGFTLVIYSIFAVIGIVGFTMYALDEVL